MTASTRTVGRPSSNSAQDAQQLIIQAASKNFAEHGIKGTSNQMIARDANVTPAMVHYYFRNKTDLHQAILANIFEPCIEKLQKASALVEWVGIFHGHLSANLWIPHLMIREILPHNGSMRPIFLQQFGPRIFSSIKQMVEQEMQQQKTQKAFDVERHVILLMGMLVYPFLGLGIAENITGRKFDQQMLDGFRDDALNLFTKGIAGNE